MSTIEVKELIEKMTLEEKASLCSGLNFWDTKPIKRLNLSKITMSDGPYGIRKQSAEDHYLDFHTSKKFICFPTAAGMAASFNKKLWYEFGETFGKECNAEGVDVLLGPALNIKRSPLGGRNFEYLSEDPLLSGTLAAQYVLGLQKEGISASVKHFAANNQESRRMSSSSNMDDRTLQEIYLDNFRKVVEEAKPDTVMCSYNQINHTYVSENKLLLTDILRGQWGFEGVVITDWGAICDRVKGLLAGIDIEMPSCGGVTDLQIVEAVQNENIKEEDLNIVVERILKLVLKHQKRRGQTADYQVNYKEDHQKTRKYAEESMVLLKNENKLLPLPNKNVKIAFIGEFAENPRFEGGGSSHINSWKIDTPLEYSKNYDEVEITYSKGYDLTSDEIEEELVNEATKAAIGADFAVVFVGLPERYESESYDRKNMEMPVAHNRLVEEIVKQNPNTIVVLQNGSPITMPWLDKVPAVLEAYLGGEAAGAAIVDIIFGKVNPSGHLAETFPFRIEDTPCYLNFPGHLDEVNYQEGVYVGYRYYTSKKMPVLFPFGHGLSYTYFEYTNLTVSSNNYLEGDKLVASVTVKNIGKIAGKAVVQLYVEPDKEALITDRPIRELKSFDKVELAPGEEKIISLTLDEKAFSYYDADLQNWYVAPGKYKVQIASDCNTVICEEVVYARPVNRKPFLINRNTLIGDLLENSQTTEIMEAELPGILAHMGITIKMDLSGRISRESIPPFVYELPIRALISFTNGTFKEENVKYILDRIQSKLNQ